MNQRRHYRTIMKCQMCGEDFEAVYVTNKPRYCSPDCMQKRDTAQNAERYLRRKSSGKKRVRVRRKKRPALVRYAGFDPSERNLSMNEGD